MDAFGIPIQALLDQMLLGLLNGSLRDAEPGPGGRLRPVGDRELRARRAVHDLCLRDPHRARPFRHQPLGPT